VVRVPSRTGTSAMIGKIARLFMYILRRVVHPISWVQWQERYPDTSLPQLPKLMLREQKNPVCDYTLDTLKENMPKALAPVPLETIRRWEHRTQRWMEAYRSGMETRDAQKHVRTFSSRIYKSHRRISERVARQFD